MITDLFKLSEKYRYPSEPLTDGKYIDDNALFVYLSLKNGRFSGGFSEMTFLYLKPFEWSDIDFISFLISVSRKYGFEIRNIKTNMCPIEEEYEVSLFDENDKIIPKYEKIIEEAIKKQTDESKYLILPKIYGGAYKWLLDKKEKGDVLDEAELFDNFLYDIATPADIERALIYATRLTPLYEKEDTERYMSKDFFGKIIDWTTFSIAMTAEQKTAIENDVNEYIEAFMSDKLERNDKTKRVKDVSVSQSRNIFTFKKHCLLFREYLQKMYDDFGNKVTIENIFEEGYLNGGYHEGEEIRNRFMSRNFFFVHTLFAFEKMGMVKIITLGSNWDYHEDHLLAYQAKIEILEPFFDEEAKAKLAFDMDKSRFFVQGKEIKILKFKDEYHTLRVLFEDPKELSKEWFFSEISERVDKYNKDDKKYYNAVYQLKLKLEKVGIKDFFTTTKQSVKINKKYLS